ncbi:hypothetical protein [Lewinella sp. IMCC34183]|uniref:hypothetical protein n=1 Tax=Lewinella sp. IMCC34183 TaxID=2248762 RepID=UPI0013003CDB|nr:hypothetical protein [Lewinella sp. IMCC34183]
MARGFAGLGFTYHPAPESPDGLEIVPRLLGGINGTLINFDEGGFSDGGINVAVAPGIAIRSGDFVFAADVHVSLSSLLEEFDETSSAYPAGSGGPTSFPTNSVNLAISWRPLVLAFTVFNRKTRFADAVTGLDENRYAVTGLQASLGWSFGRYR